MIYLLKQATQCGNQFYPKTHKEHKSPYNWKLDTIDYQCVENFSLHGVSFKTNT